MRALDALVPYARNARTHSYVRRWRLTGPGARLSDMTPDRPMCECGCDTPVAWQKNTQRWARFVSGHNGRGRRKTPGIVDCIQCKSRVEVMPHLAHKGRKFCSAQCRDEHRRQLLGPLNPSYKPTPCGTCGVPTSGRRGYCSKVCGRIGRAKTLAATWALKPATTWKAVALNRDEHRCRLCGFALVPHVHHIVRRADGGTNDLENLITVCPNHHAMVHAGLVSSDTLRRALTKPLPLPLGDGATGLRASRESANFRRARA